MSCEEESKYKEPDESQTSRTFEEIDKVFGDAHVELQSLKPVYQALWFEEKQPHEDNLFLMELDKKLLSGLKEGQSLVFRGDKDDTAVVCTDDQTFNVQVAEISNSLALVPDIVWSANANGTSEERVITAIKVQKIFFEYFELQPTCPRITKLLSLLEETCYKGPKNEEIYIKNHVEFKSTRDLLMKVQASEAELLQALKDNCVCFLNGYWRVLDQHYHHSILSDFFKIVADKSWPLNRIPKEEALELFTTELPEDPVEVLEHLIDWYCENTKECDEEGRGILSLREDRVCRFLGEVLLKLAAKLELEDFLEVWQRSVPKGLKVDLKYLAGIALRNDTTNPPSIFFFPEWELPDDVGERFKVLFSVKPKWSIDEIKPYIEKLTTEKMNVNAMLTKHAIGCTVDGKRCYSARHGH